MRIVTLTPETRATANVSPIRIHIISPFAFDRAAGTVRDILAGTGREDAAAITRTHSHAET
jgi:hypothetical protein